MEEKQERDLAAEYEKNNPFWTYIESPSLLELRLAAEVGELPTEYPIMMTNEVVIHNKMYDCWVILFGFVLNLTPLIDQYIDGPDRDLVKPIIAFAGKDISHWFNQRTGEIVHFIHPITGVLVPYTPHGPIPDVGYQAPTSDWAAPSVLPWWKDRKYIVGRMTESSRKIRIMNVLTSDEVLINVCCEDTLNRILERYLKFNSHARSYTWKFNQKVLDMSLTLQGNGIIDERKMFAEVRMSEDYYIPCIMLYFNDDLTEA